MFEQFKSVDAELKPFLSYEGPDLSDLIGDEYKLLTLEMSKDDEGVYFV
jgi:hypothetical protein